MEHLYEKDPLIQKIAAAEEICWINEKRDPGSLQGTNFR